MSQDRWGDLYDRLTSRKFLLCLFMLSLAIAGYSSGHSTWGEFQQAALTAIGVYTVAEGATDAVGALRPAAPDPAPTAVAPAPSLDDLADKMVARIRQDMSPPPTPPPASPADVPAFNVGVKS